MQESAGRYHANDLATSKILEEKEKKVLMTEQPKHRILIIGYILVRGHAERLSDNFGHFFNLTGYVKPNADLNIITITAKLESENMSKYDVIILCGCAKNIGKNETHKKLCCILQ